MSEDQLFSTGSRPPTPKKILFEKEIQTVLKKINDNYETGCIEYYTSETKNNDWSNTFDQFEKAIQQDSDGLFKSKLVWFEKTIMDLIDKYKKMKNQMRQMGWLE